MRLLKILLAGAAVGVIVTAFRDFENESWLVPVRPGGGGGELSLDDEPEPVLGYDGMDQETILEWISGAELDVDTLQRMYRYEEAARAREPVLSAIADLLDESGARVS